MIFSSDAEFTLLPKPGTELTIDLDGIVLTLPIVGGKGKVEKVVRQYYHDGNLK
jgi:X-Pro dipeptidyl-peptidase